MYLNDIRCKFSDVARSQASKGVGTGQAVEISFVDAIASMGGLDVVEVVPAPLTQRWALQATHAVDLCQDNKATPSLADFGALH